MSDATNEDQLAIAARLQEKWLNRMEIMLDNGEITSTDMATIARVLLANGWTLDPKKLPIGLKDKLTSHVTTEDFEFDGVFPIHPGVKVSRAK